MYFSTKPSMSLKNIYTHALLIVINIRIMHADSGWYLMIFYESFGEVVEDLQPIVSIFSNYITCRSWQIGWWTFELIA